MWQVGSGKKSKRGGARFSHKKSGTKRVISTADKTDAASLGADAAGDQDRAESGEEEDGETMESEVGGVVVEAREGSQESGAVIPISLSASHRRPRQKRTLSPEAADSEKGEAVDGNGGDGMSGVVGKPKGADGKALDSAQASRAQRPPRARREKPLKPFDPSDDGSTPGAEVAGSSLSPKKGPLLPPYPTASCIACSNAREVCCNKRHVRQTSQVLHVVRAACKPCALR